MSELIEQADKIRTQIAALNNSVRKALPTMTLYDARRLDKIVRESEDWLLGIRKVLLWPTAPPDDESPEAAPS